MRTVRARPLTTPTVGHLRLQGERVWLEDHLGNRSLITVDIWDPQQGDRRGGGRTDERICDPIVAPLGDSLPSEIIEFFATHELARRALSTPVYRLIRTGRDRYSVITPISDYVLLRRVALQSSVHIEVFVLIELDWPTDLEAIHTWESGFSQVARFDDTGTPATASAVRRPYHRSRADRTRPVLACFVTRWKGVTLLRRFGLRWVQLGSLLGFKPHATWHHLSKLGLVRFRLALRHVPPRRVARKRARRPRRRQVKGLSQPSLYGPP
jgi:hypothetical protein